MRLYGNEQVTLDTICNCCDIFPLAFLRLEVISIKILFFASFCGYWYWKRASPQSARITWILCLHFCSLVTERRAFLMRQTRVFATIPWFSLCLVAPKLSEECAIGIGISRLLNSFPAWIKPFRLTTYRKKRFFCGNCECSPQLQITVMSRFECQWMKVSLECFNVNLSLRGSDQRLKVPN